MNYRPLMSRGRLLSDDPTRLGRLKPSSQQNSIQELCEQYQQQGYIWVKQLLNPSNIKNLRQYFFEIGANIGLFDKENVLKNISFSSYDSNLIIKEFLLSTEYLKLVNSPVIINFLKTLCQKHMRPIERRIVRCKLPYDTARDTGGHYDYLYMRGGAEDIVTAWIPIGDIPLEMGGLIYLENSLSEGQKLENKFKTQLIDLPEDQQDTLRHEQMGGRGWLSQDLSSLADSMNARWLVADYEAGDIVFHNPFIIHASLSNLDPLNRIRLSTDVRYIPSDSKSDRRWNQSWNPNDGL